ncbi:SDR family NAD(P)-dependent oxidoreductase [bacterium LRH843]|nr:SDR family NAD(P)-dependent oxidoreductase [bacterium LRH843]
MKKILITGASGGIGSAIARELASADSSLFLQYYKNRSAAEELALQCEEQGAHITLIQSDLSAGNGDEQLLEGIPDGLTFHTVVHNAGMGLFGLFTELSNSDLNRMMNVHLLNPMKITRAILPQMIQNRQGKILVVSSIWGLTGASCEVVYSAAKGGLNSFVKALAKEVAPSNIQVNGVAPGAIQTDMLLNQGLAPADLQALADEIPASALGKPEDVANAVAFLNSEKANYINGQILSINGAWYC